MGGRAGRDRSCLRRSVVYAWCGRACTANILESNAARRDSTRKIAYSFRWTLSSSWFAQSKCPHSSVKSPLLICGLNFLLLREVCSFFSFLDKSTFSLRHQIKGIKGGELSIRRWDTHPLPRSTLNSLSRSRHSKPAVCRRAAVFAFAAAN